MVERRCSLAFDQSFISSFLSYNHHLIGKEIASWSSEEKSQHHLVHWTKLPNSSLKPGSSFEKELHVTWRHKATQNACHSGLQLTKQLAMSTKLMANKWQSRALKNMKKQFLDHGLGIKPHWDGRTQKTAKRLQLKLVKLTTVNN